MKNMRRETAGVLLRVAAGVISAGLILIVVTPVPRKPGVYVQTRHRASLSAEYSGRTAPSELAPGETLNLNSADQKELERLDGVGEKLAKAVIAYRAAHGPFHSVEELTRVDGIGPERLKRLRPYLTVE